jgi:hypothetical protein
MLASLGAIVDDLYRDRRRRMRLRKRLVFIVGNGIRFVSNILNEAELRKKARKKRLDENREAMTPAEFEVFRWRHFEFARYWTANSLPSFAHCCVHRLVQDGLCRDLITTNYDLFFDTIWERSDFPIACNPVANPDEYLWEGYYSRRHAAKNLRRYWKIHGSLSHVCFVSPASASPHPYRLPRFAVSINDDTLARAYEIPSQAPFMGYESEQYCGTPFSSLHTLSGSFLPFIDRTYGNNRTPFQREIDGAKAVLADQRSLAAVVLLGFSGYYNQRISSHPWNEELVPAIENLLRSGFDNVYMAVHQKQFERMSDPRHGVRYGLMRTLDAAKRCYVYRKAGHFATELLKRNSRCFPYNYAENAYARWKRWYLDTSEPAHA